MITGCRDAAADHGSAECFVPAAEVTVARLDLVMAASRNDRTPRPARQSGKAPASLSPRQDQRWPSCTGCGFSRSVIPGLTDSHNTHMTMVIKGLVPAASTIQCMTAAAEQVQVAPGAGDGVVFAIGVQHDPARVLQAQFVGAD